MKKKSIKSLEKIGYTKQIPKGEDINEYESINLKNINGQTTTLFRKRSTDHDQNNINNFTNSWKIFNSYLPCFFFFACLHLMT